MFYGNRGFFLRIYRQNLAMLRTCSGHVLVGDNGGTGALAQNGPITTYYKINPLLKGKLPADQPPTITKGTSRHNEFTTPPRFKNKNC